MDIKDHSISNTALRRIRKHAVRLSLVSLFFTLAAILFWLFGHPFITKLAQMAYGPIDETFIQRDMSAIAIDRNGKLLRAFTTKEDRWRLPVEPENVSAKYLKFLLTYEDKNFYTHRGADPMAFIRAAKQLVTNGRIVSGGSTLTMQVARLLEPREHRSLTAKLKQTGRALQLETRYSKQEILKLYLQLAPFGGNLEGIRAASLAYFGKEPKHLSLAQSALLVALPQNPEMRRPDRFPRRAKAARDWVLSRMIARGVISAKNGRAAMAERIPTRRRAFPKYAPHLTHRFVSTNQDQPVHKLTINREVQKRVERLAKSVLKRLPDHHSLAIIVAKNKTGEVLAHIGSPNLLDHQCAGYIDMTTAIRSPGSALKPLIYGLGFEDGIIHPDTLIEDVKTRFGNYAPQNFDDVFHGTVSIRKALQKSLNIPAVKVLEKVGPARFVARMKQAGLSPKLPGDANPNLSLALGGLGMTLEQMTAAYLGLANEGRMTGLHYTSKKTTKTSYRSLMNAPASWYLSDIMAGAQAPHNSRTGRIAFKTGTSYGYRDAWAIGYNGEYTVSIWVGRPDGAASPGLTGARHAVPVLFDTFGKLREHKPLHASTPEGVIDTRRQKLPSSLRYFASTDKLSQTARLREKKLRIVSMKPRIVFPPNNTKIALENDEANGFDEMPLKAEGGKAPLTWLVNGRPLSTSQRSESVFWRPDSAGFSKISILDAEGKTDSITVRIESE